MALDSQSKYLQSKLSGIRSLRATIKTEQVKLDALDQFAFLSLSKKTRRVRRVLTEETLVFGELYKYPISNMATNVKMYVVNAAVLMERLCKGSYVINRY